MRQRRRAIAVNHCPECGAAVADGATFCASCGEMLPAPRPAQSDPAPTSSSPPTPPDPAGPARSRPVSAPRPGTRRPQGQPGIGGGGSPVIIRIPGRRRPVASSGAGRGAGGMPPGFVFPPQRAPRPARPRGGCCVTTLLRLLLLVLFIPFALFVLPYLVSSLGQSEAPQPAPTTTPGPTSSASSGPSASSALSTSSVPSASSTPSTLGVPPAGPGATTAGSLTLTPTAGSSPLRLDATPCPVAAAPYPGVAVGPGTSCAFAADTRLAYVSSGAAGKTVTLTVFDAATGRNTSLTCTGQAPVTCSSAGGRRVYLATAALGARQ